MPLTAAGAVNSLLTVPELALTDFTTLSLPTVIRKLPSAEDCNRVMASVCAGSGLGWVVGVCQNFSTPSSSVVMTALPGVTTKPVIGPREAPMLPVSLPSARLNQRTKPSSLAVTYCWPLALSCPRNPPP